MEDLEGRALLTAVPGVDYGLSGYRWANPSRITYSIAPDGVPWDHGINDLNAIFNARFGDGPWQRAIARALATWESWANINIAQVADSPLDFNAPGLAQGDPRFGDIRFAGYAFYNDTTTLARTYFPPPDTGTGSGDDEINTAMGFNFGSDYDLYSVILHETGLALGLAEVANPAEVMDGTYRGIRAGLSAVDSAGIQALYGPRIADAFQQQGQGRGAAGAIDLTARLDAAHRLTLGDLSLATPGDTEYFSVVAPSFPGATLQVSAAAGSISLLSPRVSILDATGRVLDIAGDPDAWGNDVTARVGPVVPGQRYLIAVTGATSDVFAVGAYQLAVAFGGDPSPSATPPTPAPSATPTPAPIPLPTPPATTIAETPPTGTTDAPIAPDSFEPNNTLAQATALGTIVATRIKGLSLHAASDVDDFSFRVARAGIYQVSAPGTTVRVLDGAGNPIVTGSGQVAFRSLRARTSFDVEVGAPDGAPVATYSLTIAPQAPGRSARRPGGGFGVRGHGHGPTVRRPVATSPRALARGIPRP